MLAVTPSIGRGNNTSLLAADPCSVMDSSKDFFLKFIYLFLHVLIISVWIN